MNERVSAKTRGLRDSLLITAAICAVAASVPAMAQDAPQADEADAESIVVTGTRLSATGFTAPTPVTVMDADRIAKIASPTVGEALAQLPSFRPSSTPNTQNIFPANAGARISDLRGLGASRTLVLLDGRRFTPSTSTGSIDLNMMPTLLIRSTEIVTGGASAAYGSDAVSGVINLRLDTRLDGLKATAGYGVTDRGDGDQYFWQIGAGKRFADDRGRFIFGAEYNKDEGTGGCYTRDFCGNEVGDLTNVPGLGGRPAHNIITGMRTATLTPGGLITATINGAGTSTPARGGVLDGIQFGPNGSPTQFVYGQNASGLFQQGGSGEGLNAFFDDPLLSIPVTRYNTFAHLEYEFSPAFTAFLEGSYGHVDGFTRGPEIRAASNIAVDNPFLPASIRTTMQNNGIAAISVGKLGVDFGRMDSTSIRDTYRIVGGAQGDLGGGWSWDAHAQYGETAYKQNTINNRINARYANAVDAVAGPNGPICRINADSNPNNNDPSCVALNILGQGQYSQAAKNYAFGTTWQDNKYTQLAGAVNINGTPFETWAGPVAFAVGVEGRRNTLDIRVDPISAANGFYVFNQTPSAGNTSVVEGYVELGVPLLRESAVGSLDLNGAIRQAHYKNEGAAGSNTFNATTWKVGATYKPVNWAMLRTTYSRDFRAPNTSELFTTPVSGVGVFYDTVKGAEKFMNVLTGGNVRLRPETANTFTAGFTLQPQGALQGLRFSADYYNIRINDAIATLSAQVILNTCNTTGAADVCSLVQRDANNFVDTISVLFLNLNRQQLRGVDFEAGYNLPFGGERSVDFRLLATHTIDFTNSALPGIDRAGDNSASGIPSWILDGMVSLDMGRLGVNLQGRYLSSGKYDATLIGPEDAGYSITLPNSINTNRVPSRFYTNVGVTFDLMSEGSKKVELFANVYNLFDVMPPPYWNGNNNAVYYDNVGRRYRMGARVVF
ncbi:outer membrane receptor protein involved in Fe transport [Sphingobium sp. B1D7B]|uniref:TonB-dependent receptor domain-containing protein n=1 Tax=unclassified Sphingobium TaxID=2611147 RepID=UPI00222518D3|nr:MULTISPECIES: TonB-dependent receptor [unclassified Sphingobium]MCW2392726.1 outer membrane receptor protein involved in Fe transport [Sphingobium sp. B11D3A]MCW2395827.1 outer membrane receptor protein involved in Fe transport [Sphingobium sp. B8D3B]MCW2404459.1 outer membrane receptor protein involved in Fe transport [Sphingobium sp. B1D7B]MCW2419342.1 outer membrane receptor protein involved in Fe transport [Sphingobium sp. B8D3C]